MLKLLYTLQPSPAEQQLYRGTFKTAANAAIIPEKKEKRFKITGVADQLHKKLKTTA